MKTFYHPENYGLSFHEAGHAVAAILIGHKFTEVALGLGNGHLGITNGEILNSPQAEAKNIKDLIQIFCAGQVADEILHDKKLPIRSTPDYEVIQSAMRRVHLTQSGFDRIYSDTKTLLKQNWRAVTLVAEGLRNKNVVDYKTVKQIVNQ